MEAFWVPRTSFGLFWGSFWDALLFENQVGGVTLAKMFCIDFPKFGDIFDAVSFESRVGGVAVAMTFASIFHFEFWFLWGVFLMLFWMPFGSLLDPKCVAWSPFGVVWGCFESLFRVFGRHFGCCGVPWGSFGGPRALLGRPRAPRG